jgi:hypothetical protein
MTTAQHLRAVLLICAAAIPAFGQTTAIPAAEPPAQSPATAILQPASPTEIPASSTATAAPAVQQLLSFQPTDVKFDLTNLMDILRDRRHEGWVLVAYPDPKTGHPLIGAGFSLDLPEREHPQRDPLNPRPFVEPSSAQLWQAAGLAPERLQHILDEYWRNNAVWSRRIWMRRITPSRRRSPTMRRPCSCASPASRPSTTQEPIAGTSTSSPRRSRWR